VTVPTPNLPLLRRVLDHIDAYPELWKQRRWRHETQCGTAYCFAGWAAQLDGAEWLDSCRLKTRADDPAEHVYRASHAGVIVQRRAQRVLGLTYEEADELFDEDNARADVQRIAERVAARAEERL
jgi:hypothetical protein